MSSKIAITGPSGMLGWDLVRCFQSDKAFEVITLERKELDITDERRVVSCLSHFNPSVVINAAAYTDVDGAENHRDLAQRTNVLGPRNLARWCHENAASLVHFSTDQVFDGNAKSPRREDEAPHPANWYAQTKFDGEKEVLSFDNNLVLRVQWLYGQRKDRFSALRQKTSFTPIVDQIGCPTWTKDVAEAVRTLVSSKVCGLYHFSYDDSASWFDVFQFVVREWGLSIELIPKRTMELALPAVRPLYSVLSNAKLKKALGRSTMGSWQDSLREFLGQVGNIR